MWRENWLKPDYPFRKLALELGPQSHRFLSRNARSTVWTISSGRSRADNLHALAGSGPGHARRLDTLTATEIGRKSLRAARCHGSRTGISGPHRGRRHSESDVDEHGSWFADAFGAIGEMRQRLGIPAPAVCAFALRGRSEVGACLEIAEWRGGDTDLEDVLFAEADCVTATGSDETLAAIRSRLPIKTRFVGYGHRVSLGFVAREVLSPLRAPQIATRATDDVVAWNQLGCLSPHVIYVQTGGEVSPERFAELLADELERREQTEPRGGLPVPHTAAIASRRGVYEVRAAHSPETRLWHSKESTAWTVVFEADPRFQVSCLNRFIYVKPVKDLAELLQQAEVVRGKISTVGTAAGEHQTEELALQLARWGVTRVCPLGRMQNPPLTWRHDGRPALVDLVTWTDFEM